MNPQLSIYSIFALLIGLFLSATVMAAPGDLDPSFSQDGKTTELIGHGGYYDTAFANAIQSDGKIVVASQVTYGLISVCGVVRYNPDGSLDNTFAGNGTRIVQSSLPFICTGIAIQTDGKIVVSGWGTNDFGVRLIVFRLNPDGTNDTSFNGDGKLISNLGGYAPRAQAIVIQPDGKIVVAGTNFSRDFVLVRINPNGSLDNSFDGDGIVSTDLGGYDEMATAVTVLLNGKIVAAGYSEQINNYDIAVARYNPDGSLDTSFDGDGKLIIESPNYDEANSITVQPDGKIVIAGESDVNSDQRNDIVLVRINDDGSLDTSFDGDGKVLTDIQNSQDYARAVAIQPDGKIIVAGTTANNVLTGFLFVRYNADGSLDNTFDNDGKKIFEFSGGAVLFAMSIQSDGKLVAAGRVGTEAAVIRCDQDGTIDTSFATEGLAKIQNSIPISFAKAVAVQPDGKIVAAGYITNFNTGEDFMVIRYNTDGTRDPSFGNGGIVITEIPDNESPSAVAIQPDGKIIVAGVGRYSLENVLVRYNQDGSLDTSFDGDGKLIVRILDRYLAFGMALQSDGKILIVAGNYQFLDTIQYGFALARFNPDGSFDSSFDGDGIVKTRISTETWRIDASFSIAVQSDGKIIVAGRVGFGSHSEVGLVRYNPDGSLDNSFDGDGIVRTMMPDNPVTPYAIGIQPDGKIVVAGGINTETSFENSLIPNSYNPNGKMDITDGNISGFTLIRYNPNGSLDSTFGNEGIVLTDFGNSSNVARALAIEPDGKIIASGFTYSHLSLSDFAIAQYNSDGSLDTSFGSGGKAIYDMLDQSLDLLFGMTLDSSGRAVVVGESNGLFTVARVLTHASNSASARFDFDGDGKSDLGIYRPSTGEWWINQSSTGVTGAAAFGNSSDKIVPGDFTGDGKTDIAVWRPSTGEWFILRSEDGSYYSVQFGANGDVPSAGDFDGDRKTDLAVFRPTEGVWYINKSSGGYLIIPFGTNGDVPVPADYDGDGKSDIAIWRPSDGSWWYQPSSDTQFCVFKFGVGTDKPVQGDYTGDGKADIAVWRPSTGEWYIQRSEDNSFYSVPFGASGDIPIPGDYDGDGKFDTAVFRPSGSTWYINRSTTGLLITAFGLSTDKPVPSAFVP